MGHRPGWTKVWTADLASCEARHESGLIITFVEDGDGWAGEIKPGTEAALLKLGAASAAQVGARLLREAGDAYKRALDRRQ